LSHCRLPPFRATTHARTRNQALDTSEETTAQLQLLVCVLLAVTFLLLHTSLHPFKRGLLNRLERVGLTAIALR
jgi:hypothetical protein